MAYRIDAFAVIIPSIRSLKEMTNIKKFLLITTSKYSNSEKEITVAAC